MLVGNINSSTSALPSAHSIILEPQVNENLFLTSDVNTSIEFLDWNSPIDIDEVTFEIKQINISKSSGYCAINAFLLKEALLCLT